MKNNHDMAGQQSRNCSTTQIIGTMKYTNCDEFAQLADALTALAEAADRQGMADVSINLTSARQELGKALAELTDGGSKAEARERFAESIAWLAAAVREYLI